MMIRILIELAKTKAIVIVTIIITIITIIITIRNITEHAIKQPIGKDPK